MNDEQRKAMFAKRKRTRNTGKGVKLNSYGFKVPKNTKFYIGKATEGQAWKGTSGKRAFSPKLVAIFQDMWNNDPRLKMLRKHINEFSMVYASRPQQGGYWDESKKKVKLYDYPNQTQGYFRHTVVHEIVGHVFWDLARKWRREELVEFNKIANALPPINDYVKKNEEKWKKWNDVKNEDFKALDKRYGLDPENEWDSAENLPEEKRKKYFEDYNRVNEDRKTNGHDTMTRYANEQHSAITEIMYGDAEGGHKILISDSDKSKLIDVWNKLHY